MKMKHFSFGRRGLGTADDGAALAEMAIILPLLALVLSGVIEAGRFGYYSILACNAARAGVQYGAQNLYTAADDAGMQSSALADGQNVPGLTATSSHSCQCADGSASTCQPTDCASSHRIVFVQVTTTGTFGSLLNYPGLPDSLRAITVTNSAVMRVSP